MTEINICKDNDMCGNCTYQNKTYEEQLQIKNDLVLEHLANRKVKYDKYLGI